MTEFPAKAGMGTRVRARVLVATDGFSARHDIDRINGVFSESEHELAAAVEVDPESDPLSLRIAP